MADAYRVATKVPWEDHVRDWSRKFSALKNAVDEIQDRAKNHRGQEFKVGLRGEHLGPDKKLPDAANSLERIMRQDAHFGDMGIMKSEKDNVAWFIRKLKDADPAINLSEANQHIDTIYTWFFKTHRPAGIENWGTCNRRFIDGTTTWSEHCPWNSPDAGCNAIDLHSGYQTMFDASREAANQPSTLNGHVAKVLFYGHEWTKNTGWIYVPVVGHYDHVHIEGPRDHGGLASACRY